MQLTDLISILAKEAQSSCESLHACAETITSLEDGDTSSAVLETAADTYADFCSRTAAAAESLGLSGLSTVGSMLSDGLQMASGLPLELRAPARPLLVLWPEFFVAYLEHWRLGTIADAPVGPLLQGIAEAEYLTPVSDEQRAEIEHQLASPPSLAEQQRALTAPYEPLDEEAISLALPEDADASVLEGLLLEGPDLIQKLTQLVVGFGAGNASAPQLELAHRLAHTLKGNAAMAGLRGIATLSHALEDVLEAFRGEDFTPPEGMHRALNAGCDQIDLALESLANRMEPPADFPAVTRTLHAWAAHLQGLEVPEDALSLDALAALGSAPARLSSTDAPALPEAVTSLDSVTEDDVQIRIPAKALDRIFRAVNELAMGLMRLRTQSDDVMRRADAITALEQTANQRLAEIEQRVTVQGLGKMEEAGSSTTSRSNMGRGMESANEFDSLELDRYNELTGATQALNEAIVDMRVARQELVPQIRDVSTLVQRQLDFAREAQYQVAQARLRPLSDLRARLRRIVRQTAVAVGRDVDLVIQGDELRVDAAVLGPLSEALLHLLRNSVDHGIEPPDVRIAAGKPATGSIRLEFASYGGGVTVRVIDDGAGLDHEAILEKATWAGLVDLDAELTPDQIARLIFLPGFSTRNDVTQTSGRGVGLDAVVQAAASLQGNVTVRPSAQGGTEFRMFIMSTVGTLHALHVQAGGEHYLVPSVQLQRADVAQSVEALALADESDTAPPVWLPALLYGDQAQAGPMDLRTRPGLIVDVDGTPHRIAIDAILEAREFLITSPPALISRIAGVSGVTTLPDGRLATVLDLQTLSRTPLPVQAQGLHRLQAAAPDQLHVLVTDDSASVRNTVSALLRDANYRVSTARDGIDAMRSMLDQRFDLVLTDLEMPQLNGFELTEFIRNRSDQPDIPVLMLTSRGQEKHRAKAADSGVTAFLVKPYSDQHLLDTIRDALKQSKAQAIAA